MVDARLLSICKENEATVREIHANGMDRFFEVVNNKQNLELTVQYVNDRIYCVYFSNSQFFEIPDEKLYAVISGILSSHYHTETKGIFRKRSIIVVDGDEDPIFPERN